MKLSTIWDVPPGAQSQVFPNHRASQPLTGHDREVRQIHRTVPRQVRRWTAPQHGCHQKDGTDEGAR